jgi:hypothetical protein
VPPDQRFGLVALLFARVIRVMLEIAPLQQGPVYLIELC